MNNKPLIISTWQENVSTKFQAPNSNFEDEVILRFEDGNQFAFTAD